MTNTTVPQGHNCTICGLPVTALSYGGPDICPSCDAGNFGIKRIERQADRIRELEAAGQFYKDQHESVVRRHRKLQAAVADWKQLYHDEVKVTNQLRTRIRDVVAMADDAERERTSWLENHVQETSKDLRSRIRELEAACDEREQGAMHWHERCRELEAALRVIAKTKYKGYPLNRSAKRAREALKDD